MLGIQRCLSIVLAATLGLPAQAHAAPKTPSSGAQGVASPEAQASSSGEQAAAGSRPQAASTSGDRAAAGPESQAPSSGDQAAAGSKPQAAASGGDQAAAGSKSQAASSGGDQAAAGPKSQAPSSGDQAAVGSQPQASSSGDQAAASPEPQASSSGAQAAAGPEAQASSSGAQAAAGSELKTSSSASKPAPLRPGTGAASRDDMPEFEEVSVLRSNYRRVVWGHTLTAAGVVGVLTAAAGMVVLGQGTDRYRALKSLPQPLDPANAQRLDELTRQRKVGLGLSIGGAVLGVGGLVAGSLLIRSARRRERARRVAGWSQFRPRMSFSLVWPTRAR